MSFIKRPTKDDGSLANPLGDSIQDARDRNAAVAEMDRALSQPFNPVDALHRGAQTAIEKIMAGAQAFTEPGDPGLDIVPGGAAVARVAGKAGKAAGKKAQPAQLQEQMAKQYGRTDDWRDAGWLTPDGQMIRLDDTHGSMAASLLRSDNQQQAAEQLRELGFARISPRGEEFVIEAGQSLTPSQARTVQGVVAKDRGLPIAYDLGETSYGYIDAFGDRKPFFDSLRPRPVEKLMRGKK